MSKQIIYSDEARKGLLSGVKKIAKAVKGTLGPSGRNVLIKNNLTKELISTKDGVTVAAQVSSDIYIEQLAIESVQEAANNADNNAGDGTTTATILTEAIFSLGAKSINEKTNVIDMKRGIDIGTAMIVEQIEDLSEECNQHEKQLKEVALISSNNDISIAQIVVDAFKVAGNQGVVNIKRSRDSETFLTTIEGMNIGTGFQNRAYINDAVNDLVELDKPYIYMTNTKIDKVTPQFDAIIQHISGHQESLLIICKDIDPQITMMLIGLKDKHNLKVCVCKAPHFGLQQTEELEDLGIMLGKPPFIEGDGVMLGEIEISSDIDRTVERSNQEWDDLLRKEVMSKLPRSEDVFVTKNRLSIKGPYGLSDDEYKKIEKLKTERADFLRGRIKSLETSYEKSAVQTRISRLTDGIAYINIGAFTDIEFNDKQHRIQDSLYAVKSAYEEGILPGGGTALLYISGMKYKKNKNKDIQLGISIVLQAIQAPFVQILSNVGIIPDQDSSNSFKKKFNTGINARTHKIEEDMIGAGVIDPAKVTRVALVNAASIAGMLLTTDCVIIDTEAYKKQPLPQGY